MNSGSDAAKGRARLKDSCITATPAKAYHWPTTYIADQLPADDGLIYGMVLRPNCFLSFISDHVMVRRFEPVAVDRTRTVCEWLFPAGHVGRRPVQHQQRGRPVREGQ